MSQPLAFKSILLTGTASAQNIIAAAEAIDPTIGAFMASASQVTLQGDPGNSTNNVLIGDDALTTSRYGLALTSSLPPVVLRSHRGADIPLSNMYFIASAGSPKLLLCIFP